MRYVFMSKDEASVKPVKKDPYNYHSGGGAFG